MKVVYRVNVSETSAANSPGLSSMKDRWTVVVWLSETETTDRSAREAAGEAETTDRSAGEAVSKWHMKL